MEQNFNEDKKTENTNKGQVTQTTAELSKGSVKVDGTYVLQAARFFGNNMYRTKQNIDSAMQNKPGRPYLEPKKGRKR